MFGADRPVFLTLVIALVAVAPAGASGRTDSVGRDPACRPAVAGGFIARNLHVHRIGCPSAKVKLRRWMGQDRPLIGRHPPGWFCYSEEGLIICSYLRWRSSGVVPNFYFSLRKPRT